MVHIYNWRIIRRLYWKDNTSLPYISVCNLSIFISLWRPRTVFPSPPSAIRVTRACRRRYITSVRTRRWERDPRTLRNIQVALFFRWVADNKRKWEEQMKERKDESFQQHEMISAFFFPFWARFERNKKIKDKKEIKRTWAREYIERLWPACYTDSRHCRCQLESISLISLFRYGSMLYCVGSSNAVFFASRVARRCLRNWSVANSTRSWGSFQSSWSGHPSDHMHWCLALLLLLLLLLRLECRALRRPHAAQIRPLLLLLLPLTALSIHL